MTTHGDHGDLCTDDCRHICDSRERGGVCEDLFEDPIAGLVACVSGEEVA